MKTRGLRVKGDDTPIAPGEFRDVDIASGALRDNIMPLPYKEPSQVLLALLNQITDEGRRLGSIADMNISDMGANAPVGTTLALLERQLKTMSAVQARVHFSMKEEFQLLRDIIRDYTPEEYSFDPSSGDRKAKRSDYDMVAVIPVSDPNSATMAQRIMQYQAVIQLSQGAPQIYDLPQLHRQMIEVLGIKNADKLVPIEEDMKPMDPVSENQAVLKGKPVKAFLHQDHESHIAVHTAPMKDPIVMALIGQNPQAGKMMAAMQAHIAEHVGFGYRQKIEQQLGMPLPPEDEKLPPEMEIALSAMMAQAAQQVLQQSQAMAAQQQAQQQQQDPVVQMQQAELQIKQQEVQIKAQQLELEKQKLSVAAATAADKQKLEEQKVEGNLQLDSMRLGVQIKESQAKQQSADEQSGVRMGIDIAKHKAQNALQTAQMMANSKPDNTLK
jgi:hypothetical protein